MNLDRELNPPPLPFPAPSISKLIPNGTRSKCVLSRSCTLYEQIRTVLELSLCLPKSRGNGQLVSRVVKLPPETLKEIESRKIKLKLYLRTYNLWLNCQNYGTPSLFQHRCLSIFRPTRRASKRRNEPRLHPSVHPAVHSARLFPTVDSSSGGKGTADGRTTEAGKRPAS